MTEALKCRDVIHISREEAQCKCYTEVLSLFSACSFVNTLRNGVAICHEVNCGTRLHLNFLHLLVVLSLTRCCQTTSYQHRPGWPIESLAWPVTLPWQPVSGKRWVPSWRQIQSKSLTVRACSHHSGSREGIYYKTYQQIHSHSSVFYPLIQSTTVNLRVMSSVTRLYHIFQEM